MKSTATTWATAGVLNGMVAGVHAAMTAHNGSWVSAAIVALSLAAAIYSVKNVGKAQREAV